MLHPHWAIAKIDSGELSQVVKTRQMMNDRGYAVETGPIVMYFLTRRMGEKDAAEIQRMIPRRDFVDKWKHLETGAHELAKKLTSKEAAVPSGAWKILSQATPESVLFLSLTGHQQAVDQKLKDFFGKWRQVKEKLPFPEMAEPRITPQLPEYPGDHGQGLFPADGWQAASRHSEVMNFLKPYAAAAASASAGKARGRGRLPPQGAELRRPPSEDENPRLRSRRRSISGARSLAVQEAKPEPPPTPPKAVAKKVATPAKPPAKETALPANKPAKKAAEKPAKKAAAKKPPAAKTAKKAAPKKSSRKR